MSNNIYQNNFSDDTNLPQSTIVFKNETEKSNDGKTQSSEILRRNVGDNPEPSATNTTENDDYSEEGKNIYILY